MRLLSEGTGGEKTRGEQGQAWASLPTLQADRPKARWDEAVEHASTLGMPCETRLREIQAAWPRANVQGGAPVVERPNTLDRPVLGPPAQANVGGLLAVHVDLLKRRKAEQLTVEGMEGGLQTLAASGMDAPVHAARTHLEAIDSTAAAPRWAGRICLMGSEGRVAGTSAQLAVALHMFSAMQRAARRRIRFTPAESVVATGRVAAAGAVEPVNPSTLSVKVQTAFFSPATRLAVPATQVQTAREARDGLLKSYPHGQLDVIGVESVEGACADRRLMRRVEVGRVRHAAQKMWQAKATIGVALFVSFLVAAFAWVAHGPVDQNPAVVSFAGEQMVLSNASGYTVDRISVGTDFVRTQESGAYNAYALHDVTGDGLRDLCWVHPTGDNLPHEMEVRCKASGADSLLWSVPMEFGVSFPRKPEVIGRKFVPRDMKVGDFDQDGTPELFLTAAHRPYFPSLLLKFDAQTGDELQRYLHPRYLGTIYPYDLNQDGAPEIVTCGSANAFESTALIVLDPRHVQGHAPTHGDYVMDGLQKAQEIAYVRIPATAVDRVLWGHQVGCRSLQFHPEDQRLLVEVSQGVHANDSRTPCIIVHFSKALKPLAVGTNDAYDGLAERLHAEQRIPRPPDYDYFQDYLEELKYWDGEGWQSEPVVRWPR